MAQEGGTGPQLLDNQTTADTHPIPTGPTTIEPIHINGCPTSLKLQEMLEEQGWDAKLMGGQIG
jgi:hypothetical protein